MKPSTSGRRARAARTPTRGPGLDDVGVARHLAEGATVARGALTTLAERLPATLRATRTGARDATSTLQELPDPTLRWLAAGSVGLGAGLFLAGRPRLVIAACVAPALALGAAIVARPVGRVVPDALLPVIAVGPREETPRRIGSGPTRHRKNGVKHG